MGRVDRAAFVQERVSRRGPSRLERTMRNNDDGHHRQPLPRVSENKERDSVISLDVLADGSEQVLRVERVLNVRLQQPRRRTRPS